MSAVVRQPLVIHGWTVFAHPLFLEQLEGLVREVEAFGGAPAGYSGGNATQLLAAISQLVFDVIPADPTRPEYRQGKTLGAGHSHWFRAKFFQQYRLFFRYHLGAKVVVFAWVNDEGTERAYESRTDAYRVFARMLAGGCPPDDWGQLVAEAREGAERLVRLGGGLGVG